MPKVTGQSKAKKTKKSKKKLSSDDVSLPKFRKFPSGYNLLKQSLAILLSNKKLFLGMLFVIGAVQLVIVQGVISSDFADIRDSFREVFGNSWNGLAAGVVSYIYLIGSSGQSGANEANLYQSTFVVVFLLACIWALRELSAGNKPRIRDTFYKGMTPLIPFILIILVLGVQLLPAAIGAWVYTTVTTNGIATHTYEIIFWFVFFALLLMLSIRFITGSIFALIIVTLNNATPVQSLKSSWNLMYKRRLLAFRKLLFLSFSLLIITTVLVLPAVFLLPAIVPILFYVTSLLVLEISVIYIYLLYKELVDHA